MSKLILVTVLVASALSVEAKKSCTDLPKDKWMSEEAFQTMAQAKGYKIRKFKQPGSCYEIYGEDKDGKKVEVYFNPVDGAVVKSK